jgi:hypothetical protein
MDEIDVNTDVRRTTSVTRVSLALIILVGALSMLHGALSLPTTQHATQPLSTQHSAHDSAPEASQRGRRSTPEEQGSRSRFEVEDEGGLGGGGGGWCLSV